MMINLWILGYPIFRQNMHWGTCLTVTPEQSLGYLLVLCFFYPSEEITVDISWYFPWCQLSGSNCTFLIYSMIYTLNMFEHTFSRQLGGGSCLESTFPMSWMPPGASLGVCSGLIGSEGVSAEGTGWILAVLNTKRLGWRALGNFNKDGGVVSQHVPTHHSFFELGRKGWMNSVFVRCCNTVFTEWKEFAMLVACHVSLPAAGMVWYLHWLASRSQCGSAARNGQVRSFTYQNWLKGQSPTIHWNIYI